MINQFLCTDSNLNLIYRARTIDTTRIAHIKIAYFDKLKMEELSSPPLYTNVLTAASGKWLFIRAALAAKNDIKEIFETHSIFDVYNVSSGKYAFSFNLRDFQGSKIRDFKVYGNKLYALNDHFIYRYDLLF